MTHFLKLTDEQEFCGRFDGVALLDQTQLYAKILSSIWPKLGHRIVQKLLNTMPIYRATDTNHKHAISMAQRRRRRSAPTCQVNINAQSFVSDISFNSSFNNSLISIQEEGHRSKSSGRCVVTEQLALYQEENIQPDDRHASVLDEEVIDNRDAERDYGSASSVVQLQKKEPETLPPAAAGKKQRPRSESS